MATKNWDAWLKEEKANTSAVLASTHKDWDKPGEEYDFKPAFDQLKQEIEDYTRKAGKNEDGKKDEWVARLKLAKFRYNNFKALADARKLVNRKAKLTNEKDKKSVTLDLLVQDGKGNSPEAVKLKERLAKLDTWISPLDEKIKGVSTTKNGIPLLQPSDTTGNTPDATGNKTADNKTANGTPTPTPTPTPTKSNGTPTPTPTPTKTLTSEQLKAQGLNAVAGGDFSLPETIFNNVPSLKKLLQEFSDPKVGMTQDEFLKKLRDDVWFKKNSGEIKARYVQYYNYLDLVKSGQASGSTDYEKQISTLERQIQDKARKMGSALASDPEAIKRAAANMYITNVSIDDPMTTDFIAAAIKPTTSMIGGVATQGYTGQALKDYQEIQSLARSNGFAVKDIIPGAQSEQQVLQGIANGSIDPTRLAQDARKLAAQGQPQYVRDLLGQGYNLDQIYAPYRNTMASILEIDDPNSIDLNDPTLRSAITDKGDTNIYDFKKALKKDNRWQYTENARQEVSDAALRVLRDFGFQG